MAAPVPPLAIETTPVSAIVGLGHPLELSGAVAPTACTPAVDAGAHCVPVNWSTWPLLDAALPSDVPCSATTRVVACPPWTSPARLPLKLAAVMAVAALPVMPIGTPVVGALVPSRRR